MIADERIKRNSAIIKIVLLIAAAIAVLYTVTSKPKMPPGAQEYMRQVSFTTIGGPAPDCGWDVLAVEDGYVACGDTRSYGSGNYDGFLVKTDFDGGLVWTRQFGGADEDHAISVERAFDGGYILAGGTRSMGAGETDAYVVKTDADGELVWEKSYGTANYDYAYSIRKTLDGCYIMAGYGSDNDDSDMCLRKIDQKGAVKFEKMFGGEGWDIAYSAEPLRDGGSIICGYTTSFTDHKSDIFVVRADAKGDCVWARTYGGKRENRGYYAAPAKDGGFIISAKSTSYISKGVGWETMLIKTDAAGNTEWVNFFPAAEVDVGRSVAELADGSFVTTGSKKCYGICDSNMYVMKVSQKGRTEWFRVFAGLKDDTANSIVQDKNGSFIVAGSTFSEGQGMGEMVLLKLDKNGEQLW